MKDNFTTLDTWSPLEAVVETPSTWTTDDNGLHITAIGGWNHRAVKDDLPTNFTVEYKVKMGNPTGSFPKAGIIIGDLGSVVPNLILGLDHASGGSSVVKFIPGRAGGEWHNFGISGFDVTKWQTIRLKKDGDAIYIYNNGMRVYFEQGDHINNIQGKLGLFAESCDADFEFISFKED